METIKLGLVGSGNMALQRVRRMAPSDDFDLIAVAARNPKTGPALANQFGAAHTSDWRELIDREDIDAVVITTHNALHGPIAIAALESGKHVLSEYPACRTIEEANRLRELVSSAEAVYCLTHRETVSKQHASLHQIVQSRGRLMSVNFKRMTPGRGTRPEVLFNLNLSGPPALFFVYHIYAQVDLFGPAAWVDSGANYNDLKVDQGYQSFVNTVTAGFAGGGLAQWTWAGGIEILRAEESLELILTDGVLRREGDEWKDGKTGQLLDLSEDTDLEQALESHFYKMINGPGGDWRSDARKALDATLIGLAAETSALENRRVKLD